MPYRAKADPWIKVETEHHYETAGGEEEYRCGTSWWSFPCLFFRRWKHNGTNHRQKWEIDEDEKEARWAANKEQLRLKEEQQTTAAVTYGTVVSIIEVDAVPQPP